MFKRNRKFGFTLLELLIVVIIVSVLASLAIPRFAKMTKKARSAEGVSIVGAFMTAEMLYYQERDTFTTAITDLAIETSPNFTITSPIVADVAAATVTATGVDGGAYSGIVVTGTIKNNGTRTKLDVTLP